MGSMPVPPTRNAGYKSDWRVTLSPPERRVQDSQLTIEPRDGSQGAERIPARTAALRLLGSRARDKTLPSGAAKTHNVVEISAMQDQFSLLSRLAIFGEKSIRRIA